MSQSLVKNLVHLVYSTKHREPLIPKEHQAALFAYQAGIFKEWESPALVIGGVSLRLRRVRLGGRFFSLRKPVSKDNRP